MTGTFAIIPAAGRGRRFGRGFNKVLAEASGKPIIAHTLAAFQASALIDGVILVCGAEDTPACRQIVDRFGLSKVTAVIEGGSHRQESVWNGLRRLPDETSIVVIHDGARPLVNERIIAESVSAASSYGAAVAAVPVTDTIKIADPEGVVVSTPDRDQLFAIQTPQAFRRELIVEAHRRAISDGFYGTDDAALVERLGTSVRLFTGSPQNIKVTEPHDLEVVSTMMGDSNPRIPLVRVGFGYDIHRFGPGRRLVLGGVEFPGEEGLEGHSDADVLLHAVCDALLGAASAGDIGRIFPDNDSQYKGISSMKLLSRVASLLAEGDWKVVNVDVTLVAQKPRIAPYAEQIRQNISSALAIAEYQVSVKATTAEGLGAIGRVEGISCYSVASVVKSGS